MQKIETESGQESLGHSSIYLLFYLCDMKVKNIGSDIYSVSLAQGGASKCLVCLLRFLSFVHIRHVVTIEIRSLRVSAIATSFQVEHVLCNFH